MSCTFTCGGLSRKAISQVSSARKLIPSFPPPHPPIDKVFLRKGGKKDTFLSVSLLSLVFIHPRFGLSVVHTQTHAELYPVVNVSHMPSS